LFFKDRVSLCTQADLEVEILLPKPPKCWDYRHASPLPALKRPFLNAVFSENVGFSLVLWSAKSKQEVMHWWLTPVILATQEADIRRM
jgi:hypothetical protein